MSIRAAGSWYFYIPTVETASDAAAAVMPLGACVQPPDAAAPAAPPPPPVAAPAPAPPPAPVAEPTPNDRRVSIQGATCERLLELSPDDRAPNGKVPAGPTGVQPLQNARIGGIVPLWRPNRLFIRRTPDQLGLTAADDAKKLQFQMNVFWLKATRIVPKGGPRRDT